MLSARQVLYVGRPTTKYRQSYLVHHPLVLLNVHPHAWCAFGATTAIVEWVLCELISIF